MVVVQVLVPQDGGQGCSRLAPPEPASRPTAAGTQLLVPGHRLYRHLAPSVAQGADPEPSLHPANDRPPPVNAYPPRGKPAPRPVESAFVAQPNHGPHHPQQQAGRAQKHKRKNTGAHPFPLISRRAVMASPRRHAARRGIAAQIATVTCCTRNQARTPTI